MALGQRIGGQAKVGYRSGPVNLHQYVSLAPQSLEHWPVGGIGEVEQRASPAACPVTVQAQYLRAPGRQCPRRHRPRYHPCEIEYASALRRSAGAEPSSPSLARRALDQRQ
jgi:hypothetical protein